MPLKPKYLKVSELKPEYREHYDLDCQELRANSQGRKSLYIMATCPICGKKCWQCASKVRHNRISPYCPHHARTRPLRPEEVSEFREYYDYDQQMVRPGKPYLVIKATCPGCGKAQWKIVSHVRSGNTSALCFSCAHEYRHWGHIKAQIIDKDGYVSVLVSTLSSKDQGLAQPMSRSGRVPEHRLVMAQYLDRPLASKEHVHHRNDDKADNRLSNLRLVTSQTHNTAPADDIAKLVTEIEYQARQLKHAGIDPIPYLEKQLKELKAIT